MPNLFGAFCQIFWNWSCFIKRGVKKAYGAFCLWKLWRWIMLRRQCEDFWNAITYYILPSMLLTNRQKVLMLFTDNAGITTKQRTPGIGLCLCNHSTRAVLSCTETRNIHTISIWFHDVEINIRGSCLCHWSRTDELRRLFLFDSNNIIKVCQFRSTSCFKFLQRIHAKSAKIRFHQDNVIFANRFRFFIMLVVACRLVSKLRLSYTDIDTPFFPEFLHVSICSCNDLVLRFRSLTWNSSSSFDNCAASWSFELTRLCRSFCRISCLASKSVMSTNRELSIPCSFVVPPVWKFQRYQNPASWAHQHLEFGIFCTKNYDHDGACLATFDQQDIFWPFLVWVWVNVIQKHGRSLPKILTWIRSESSRFCQVESSKISLSENI